MKIAKTIDEQICILKKRNMIIEDESKAREILLDIGYYRLGFYSFPFEISFPKLQHRNHIYRPNTTFSSIVELYYFDMDLRNILSSYLSRIEIAFRTYLTYTASIHYQQNPTWFADTKCINNRYLASFNKAYQEIKKSAVIKRHHQKYPNDQYAPSWKTIEFMTFGNIQKLYENIKDNDIRINIANRFGCKNERVFINYLETLRILRNSCAHGACIYNLKLPLGIKAGPAGSFQGPERHNLSGILDVVKFMMSQISINRTKELAIRLSTLFTSSRAIAPIIEESTGIKIERKFCNK